MLRAGNFFFFRNILSRMAEIILVSFNARYEHTSLGARCIFANLGRLRGNARIMEFTLDSSPESVLEDVLKEKPRIIGMGVYIWNAEICLKFARELKALRPEIILVCGGPEISHETERQPLYELADYIISGEGENAFRELCLAVLAGSGNARPENIKQCFPDGVLTGVKGRILYAAPVEPEKTDMPYDLYTEDDLENRLVYIEASRGCPFGCEFCLSSLDKKVRYFPLLPLMDNLKKLLARGLLVFKFTDRSFNLDMERAGKILEFFLDNYREGLFLHFEIVPDRIPEGLFALLAKFPRGAVQLEAGIQTFNPKVAERISRHQDYERLERNIKRLLHETGCYVHADLVAGLPGETLDSFASGFDRLYNMNVHEIQAGILKLLHGAPIARHTEAFGMKYSPLPPYEIRENRNICFEDMRRLRRFSRYWDIVSNSGVFLLSSEIICGGGTAAGKNISGFSQSPFASFMAFSDALYAETHQTHSISRARLRNFISSWLTVKCGLPEKEASRILEKDALSAVRAEKHKKRQSRHGS